MADYVTSLFLHFLKISENPWFPDAFRGMQIETTDMKWVHI